ncbi:DUF4476 domain-containing protein [bacterium]|nr:DUF4476 domain-containing protein [bacterium]
MKTITICFTLVAAFCFTSKAKASQLYLRTHSHSPAIAVVNGNQNHAQSGIIRIDFLPYGDHFMTIRQKPFSHHHRRETNHRGRNAILFRGYVFIPAHSTVYASIDYRGSLVIERVIPNPRPVNPRTPAYRPPTRPRYQPQYYRTPVHENRSAAFNQLLILMEHASFESAKLALAKQFVKTNAVTSQQVAQLMKAMDFESSKLVLAKEAYYNVLDPENFYLVNASFDFSSSISALAKYINH